MQRVHGSTLALNHINAHVKNFPVQRPSSRANHCTHCPLPARHRRAALPAETMAASDDLTTRATRGELTDAERASAWRVFLGASTDINYKKLKDDALPDAASIGSDSDPLSGLLDDSNNTAGALPQMENREEIRTDLERLVVDGFPEAHFKDPQRQTLMLDVLTVWAARNKLGYRQGMHEPRPRPWSRRNARLQQLCAGGARADGPSTRRTRMCYLTADGHQAPLFATDLGTEAPVLKLCRRFQTEASQLLSLGNGFSSVEPQLYGLRWCRLLFSREVACPSLLQLWDGLFALCHAHQKELSVVTEKCCTALICAAAPNLRGGAKEQVALEILMRYKNHVAPAVPRLLDIAARLVDGRGLPPVRTVAPVQKPVYTHGAAPVKPPRAPARPPPSTSTSTTFVKPTPARAPPPAPPPQPQTIDRAALLSSPKAPSQPSILPSSRLLRAVAVLRGSAVTEETRRQAALAQIEDVAAELRRRRL